MYLYDDYDRQVVPDRVTQFKGQMARYLCGEIAEEVFNPAATERFLYAKTRTDAARERPDLSGVGLQPPHPLQVSFLSVFF